MAGIALGEEGWVPGRVRSQGYCLESDVSRRFGLGHRTVLTTILVLSITLFFWNKNVTHLVIYLKGMSSLIRNCNVINTDVWWLKKKRCLDKCWSFHMATAYVKYP